MRAVVVSESVYGNTHVVADAIGAGLKTVTRQDRLEPQESARAREWAAMLAAGIAPRPVQGTRS